MGIMDEPVDTRQGEDLDNDRVSKFLKEAIPDLQGEITVKQFPSGFSNLTYLIKASNRDMILRRPPFGRKAKTAHDMSREYGVLKALKPLFPFCPEPLVYCDDEDVMGCPFYIMERIRGIILRKNMPKGLEFSPAQAGQLSKNLISIMAKLHSVDYCKAGLGDFGKPEGYIRRQVEGWSMRYRDARTADAPDFEMTMKWLYEHMPPDTARPAVIHNDYKLDNAVLNPDNPTDIIGVLDWEMATLGDPLMDLGSSLAYWIERDDPEEMQAIRMMPTHLQGMLSRKEQVELYAGLSGIRIDNFDFYYCFGLFRLAGIAQQIYYRYYHGQTKDERFKMLIFAVHVLDNAARRVIGESKL